MTINRFEDLEVWRKARLLSAAIYRATEEEKFSRDFALRDRIRRASISIMSNIAEGFERYSRTEFRHFLAIARGSASEVRSQLYLAKDLEYISNATFEELYGACLAISRMLAGLRASIKQR